MKHIKNMKYNSLFTTIMNYTITNPDQFRENVRRKMRTIFTHLNILNGTPEGLTSGGRDSSATLPINEGSNSTAIQMTDVTDAFSTNIEISIYNYAINEASNRKIVKKWDNNQFAQLYVDRLRSVYVNLKDQNLIQMIKSGEIPAKHVGALTHQEMKPEHWRELIDRKTKRDQSRFTQNIEASTDMFTCKKCKSKRCSYYELQTRSADEPATIFITCLDCGKHFKN